MCLFARHWNCFAFSNDPSTFNVVFLQGPVFAKHAVDIALVSVCVFWPSLFVWQSPSCGFTILKAKVGHAVMLRGILVSFPFPQVVPIIADWVVVCTCNYWYVSYYSNMCVCVCLSL